MFVCNSESCKTKSCRGKKITLKSERKSILVKKKKKKKVAKNYTWCATYSCRVMGPWSSSNEFLGFHFKGTKLGN
jgi:hypothetical protein